MSLLNKLFGNSTPKDTPTPAMEWNDLTELKQLDVIESESAQTPVILFKHSTRCPVSRMALNTFEKEYDIAEGQAKPYFLDLLQHRDISNEIASRFKVQHQSPQLILIRDGKAVYNASHDSIDAEELKKKVRA